MDHAAFQELTAGWVVGDLSPDERPEAREHLSTCASCARLAGDLDDVMVDLCLSAAPRPAPSGLEQRILSALAAEPATHGGAAASRASASVAAAAAPVPPVASGQGVLPFRPERASPGGRLGGALRAALSSSRFPQVALAASAAVLIAVMGAHSLDLRRQLSDAQAMVSASTSELRARNAAMLVVADPAHAYAWLTPSGDATSASALLVYVPGSEEAWLLADGLPASPLGMVYQFWYADHDGVHPGPAFRHDGAGVLLLPVEVELAGKEAAMLTLESADGVDDAPGADIVFGELPRA
jgi:hypothetical protein